VHSVNLVLVIPHVPHKFLLANFRQGTPKGRFSLFADRFDCIAFVETSSLETVMCKSDSSQSNEGRAQSVNACKNACNKPEC